jgi:methylation protein EvaC
LKCRVCAGLTEPVIDFGDMPIANSFLSNPDDNIYRFRMTTSFCSTCTLFQLDNQPKPELMFHDQYPFFTGLSNSMKLHFGELVASYLDNPQKKTEDLFVTEIGSNDGTLLEFVKKRNIRHLGIDPSPNVVASSLKKGVSAEVGFFGKEFSNGVKNRHGKADVIFAANVICHIPNIIDFAEGIRELLDQDGQFVFEEPYVGSMLSKTSYDQIYDEHVFIFGALSVQNIFRRVGLQLVDAIPQNTHGGSMRYVIMHKNQRDVSEGARRILQDEIDAGLENIKIYLDFAARCESRRTEFREMLTMLKSQGAKVAGYAATSKSTTVLNYCSIGSDLIQYISDSTLEKQGKFTPGTYIPVISQEEMRLNPPEYLVLFAWNHEKEILAKEVALAKHGVKWIRFVPSIEILDI